VNDETLVYVLPQFGDLREAGQFNTAFFLPKMALKSRLANVFHSFLSGCGGQVPKKNGGHCQQQTKKGGLSFLAPG